MAGKSSSRKKRRIKARAPVCAGAWRRPRSAARRSAGRCTARRCAGCWCARPGWRAPRARRSRADPRARARSTPRLASFWQKARHARCTGSGRASRRSDQASRMQRHHPEEAEERRGEGAPVGVADAGKAHQLALPLGVVAEHPHVPLVRHRLPAIARAAQPFELRAHHQRQRGALRHGTGKAVLHPPRHRRRGRIDAHPAALARGTPRPRRARRTGAR